MTLPPDPNAKADEPENDAQQPSDPGAYDKSDDLGLDRVGDDGINEASDEIL